MSDHETLQDGPNTHRYRDAGFVTEWTVLPVIEVTDDGPVRHLFHVPTRALTPMPTDPETLDDPLVLDVERLARALIENGITREGLAAPDYGIHSWRCSYYRDLSPEVGGGPCDCFEDLLLDLRAALATTEPASPSVVDITGIDAIERAVIERLRSEGWTEPVSPDGAS